MRYTIELSLTLETAGELEDAEIEAFLRDALTSRAKVMGYTVAGPDIDLILPVDDAPRETELRF